MLNLIKYFMMLVFSSSQYFTLIHLCSTITAAKRKVNQKEFWLYDLVDIGFGSQISLSYKLFCLSLIATFLLLPIAITFIDVSEKYKKVFIINAAIAWISSVASAAIYADEVAWIFD